jgi:tRNA pseudouridine55 synthase
VIDPEDQRRDGVAVVDKEAGWTSHDVVAKARGLLRNRKIGHSGTLDPDATGVLLLGVGRVTKLLRFLTALPKTYTTEIVLGTATTTLDASGDVVATYDMRGVTVEDARVAAKQLTGDILQVPPMVSAVKVGGKRLHQLAREGAEVERTPRPVTVHRFDLEPGPANDSKDSDDSDDDALVLRAVVECSSGTYVRSLAADLGTALGGGAHLRALRRTAIGSFTEADTRPLADIQVLAPSVALRDYPSVVVTGDVRTAIGFGKVLPAVDLGASGDGPWAVVDEQGELLAVYQAHKGATVKPAVVIAPA